MLYTQASGETSASDAPSENSVSRIDEATSEIERLTTELEQVLKMRNPAFGVGRLEKPQRRAGPRYALSDQDEPAVGPEFTWRSPDQTPQSASAVETWTASEADLASNTPPVNTLQWLRKARRDRRWALARSATAWGVTLFVSGIIIAAATYMLLGGMPDMTAITARLGS